MRSGGFFLRKQRPRQVQSLCRSNACFRDSTSTAFTRRYGYTAPQHHTSTFVTTSSVVVSGASRDLNGPSMPSSSFDERAFPQPLQQERQIPRAKGTTTFGAPYQTVHSPDLVLTVSMRTLQSLACPEAFTTRGVPVPKRTCEKRPSSSDDRRRNTTGHGQP